MLSSIPPGASQPPRAPLRHPRSTAWSVMQRLILFRHGKAEAESDSGDDFDRRLAPAGVSASAVMGQRLAAMGLHPDVALVSASARTRGTWAALAEAFPDVTPTFDKDLYLADPKALRKANRRCLHRVCHHIWVCVHQAWAVPAWAVTVVSGPVWAS